MYEGYDFVSIFYFLFELEEGNSLCCAGNFGQFTHKVHI